MNVCLFQRYWFCLVYSLQVYTVIKVDSRYTQVVASLHCIYFIQDIHYKVIKVDSRPRYKQEVVSLPWKHPADHPTPLATPENTRITLSSAIWGLFDWSSSLSVFIVSLWACVLFSFFKLVIGACTSWRSHILEVASLFRQSIMTCIDPSSLSKFSAGERWPGWQGT